MPSWKSERKQVSRVVRSRESENLGERSSSPGPQHRCKQRKVSDEVRSPRWRTVQAGEWGFLIN